MPSGTDERASDSGMVSSVRQTMNARFFASVFAGLLVGGGFSLLGADAVAVPAVGSMPGTLLGVAGIVVGVSLYLRRGRCEDCGGRSLGLDSGCDCSGDCD